MLERINNKEKGVDELLHGKIMETILLLFVVEMVKTVTIQKIVFIKYV